jgi:hypothetical protein
MARERRNAPAAGGGRRRERGVSAGERVRRRLAAQPDLELSEEELRALADEGIDPEEVRELARQQPDEQEASIHDRDTQRDAIEGLFGPDDDA